MENTQELESMIRNIIKEVRNSGASEDNSSASSDNGNGIFQDVDTAVSAAKKAQAEYAKCSLETREEVVHAIRTKLKPHVEYLAEESVKETGMGRVDDKIVKVNLALEKTPGVEDLEAEVLTGSDGMALYEQTPYGVIGTISPSTNPPSTLINNSIGMLAAGNSIFLSVHPGAQVISRWLSSKLNEIAREVTGINNLIVTIKKPSIEAAQGMMKHPDIDILVVTGGTGVVHQALTSGKKTIGAGAGNPPVLVDETAKIEKAADDIVWGGKF